MACQAGNNGDNNRLNETSHYVGAADFEGLDCMMNLEQYLLVLRLLLPRRVSHTFPPLDAIVPYLAETEFGDMVPLRDFTFHLPWGEVVRHGDMGHGGAAAWCQASGGGTASCTEEGVVHAETDKSNNLVHVWWLPLLRDFAECRTLSWGSTVLALTYQSLCLAAQRGITDIAGCTLLLMSWIYQRFLQWCSPDRGIYQYLLAARLVGLQQQSRDQHQARVLYWRVSIDQLRFDEALCPHWFREEEEWGTWLSAVPLVCFNIVRFHHVDRVKWQFNGEYLTTTSRRKDVWWPERLQQWYNGWRQRFDPGRRITVHHTFDTRPTDEYYDWWRGTCRVRHLSGQEVLEDPRLVELPPDVQPTASQLRDYLILPRGVSDQRRRAREVRKDTRRPARRERAHRERLPGEPVRRERARPRRARGDEESEGEAEFDRQEDEGDIPVHSVTTPTESVNRIDGGTKLRRF
ncbi:uncharacterized protein DS421_18g625000 [Arachis hypogaea]|nr:uncharacterized protein DS421_18g625000 [Arachis hypogaea]